MHRRLAEVVQYAEEARVEFLRLAAEGDGLDLTRVKGQHALFGELNFYEWILMIGQHERRHVTQLRRIGELLLDRPPSAR